MAVPAQTPSAVYVSMEHAACPTYDVQERPSVAAATRCQYGFALCTGGATLVTIVLPIATMGATRPCVGQSDWA